VNPFPERTGVSLLPAQTNPLYRTFLDQRWIQLDGGASAEVRVMTEYAPERGFVSLPREEIDRIRAEHADLPIEDVAMVLHDAHREFAAQNPALIDRKFERFVGERNDVSFQSLIEDPRDEPRHRTVSGGGAQIQVTTGRSTKFQDIFWEGPALQGTIVTVDGEERVPRGLVVVTGTDRAGQPVTANGRVSDGHFSVRMDETTTEAAAYSARRSATPTARATVSVSSRGRIPRKLAR
jgi:hypothetical protein